MICNLENTEKADKIFAGWDAQNKWSVALAEKLGYHFSHEYRAYEIWGNLDGSLSV